MRILTLFLALVVAGNLAAQVPAGEKNSEVIQFLYRQENDTLYLQGNEDGFNRLYSVVDGCLAAITTGRMPIYIDGYSASAPSEKQNYRLARIRSNRVKSELITHKSLLEEHFVTQNHTTAFNGMKDVVVVTLRIPAKTRPEAEQEIIIQEADPQPIVEEVPDPAVERQAAPVAELQLEPDPHYSRWSIGANVGLPFFWGDMTSLSADKTYFGISAGIQGTYQVSPMFGVTLSLDWAQNKAGSRGYAKGYLLEANGMTSYTMQPGTTQAYGDLYSKINMFSAGLHLDLNLSRLFGPRIANSRLKLIVSPAVYAQRFSSKVYTKNDNKVYVDENLSKDLSLGLGGDVALRYNLSPAIDLQLKSTGIWITDNLFDNIRTVGNVKQNSMWGVSAGAVWKIGGAQNMLHRKK